MAGNNLVEFLNEVLQPLGTVRSKKMFGGFGVYCDGVMFGLIADDILYLKADDINKGMFEAEGQGRFVYEGQTRPVTMSYWRIPDRLYDETDEMLDWARAALHAARAAAAKKIKLKAATRRTPASSMQASTIPASKKSRKKT